MVFAWLCFVPTAYLFVRILRSERFGQKRLLGSQTWFQVHRALTVISMVCVGASLLCIAISQGWKWRGPGSAGKFWTKIHTLLGVISSALCFIQGIIALIRCKPNHHLRPLFNWTHRIIGIGSFLLAVTTICIAATHFLKIWYWPIAEFILSLVPGAICLIMSVLYLKQQSNVTIIRIEKKHGSDDSLNIDHSEHRKKGKFEEIVSSFTHFS
ncbi:hypothetical protein WR25_17134 isoform C [Diploscapter pachys]|uniref:Cytochrome b561 domain-containing protein n=1 Tax=Diploscapter pachys TaxID=2018661 RepID=A0A2A2JGZ6_9BILA|nr:hypothetical protein WR25_17134 isoform C [Diploscapter pachys]